MANSTAPATFLAVALLAAALAAPPAYAQKERATLVGIGHTNILDTYTSEEKATGTEMRYMWEKTNRPGRWSSYIAQEAFAYKAGTRGNDNSYLGAMYNLRYGWHYNIDATYAPARPFNIRLGLLADLTLGGLYNTRNSNNPAQARASLAVDPSVMATWRFNIKGKPFALRYEAAMPLAGIAFSPNYGQSYYEIFTQGNYDHNVVVTSPFSGPQLRHTLCLDFRLWRTTFTVGYFGDIRQMEANNLKSHHYTNGIAIGWRY